MRQPIAQLYALDDGLLLLYHFSYIKIIMEKTENKNTKNFVIKSKNEKNLVYIEDERDFSMDLASNFTEDFREDLLKMTLLLDPRENQILSEWNENKSELFSEMQ